MDIRTLRSKKTKSRSARPYDRPNQSLLGKVASKVKGIFYPSWLSTWMSSGEEPGISGDPPEEESADEEDVPQTSARGSKRPRLRLHDHSPRILSEGTQTWLDAPSTSSIFNPTPRMPSTVTQSSLLQNKESTVMMNGDDHSENSEESASTSGCSSLVSHKDRLNCIAGSNLRLRESELENLRGQLKDAIGLNTRQGVTSRNESLSVHVGSSRLSLWSGSGSSSPAPNLRCRSPSVLQKSQPGFNVSAFVGPSKLNQSTDGKVSSPFYHGRTTFGGASSIRRMPVSVAPYQVDKPLRNQIKVRSNQSDDTLEGMSSAAKRILMTLEKMSSPVMDAKKIPNTNRSPVDLSLYLMPPKHRSNIMSTSTGTPKGPPIANISTISKLTTLKSCGVRRFQNSSLETLPIPAEERSTAIDNSLQQDVLTSFASGPKSGGGKMRNRLTQQHQSCVVQGLSEPIESTLLPNVPLPITTLPTFNFEPKSTRSANDTIISRKDFVFSSPIEILPNETETPRPAEYLDNLSHFGAKTDASGNDENQGFTFSRPIELELPFSVPSMTTLSNSSTSWECSSCWVKNPLKESKCLACETPRSSFGSSKSTSHTTAAISTLSNAVSTWTCSSCWIRNPVKESKCLACEEPNSDRSSSAISDASAKTTSGFAAAFTNSPSTWECSACWIQNPVKETKCLACESPRLSESVPVASHTTVKSGFGVTNPPSTWECSGCWIRNPIKETRCLACETPNPSQKNTTGKNLEGTSIISSSNSPLGVSSGANSTFFSSVPNTTSSGFKIPSSLNVSSTQAASFGGFKIPTAKPLDSEMDIKEFIEAKDQQSDCSAQVTSSSVFHNDVQSTKRAKPPVNLKRGRERDSSSNINGPSNVSSLIQKSSNAAEGFSFDSEKEKTNGAFSFKSSGISSPSPVSTFNANHAPGFSVSGDWECDICLVKNSSDVNSCSACDARRITKTNISGLKDPDSFKFSSPSQSSPITFKFGTSTSKSLTDTNAVTSSSAGFTFATPSSTCSTFFALSSASSNTQASMGESKSLYPSDASDTKIPVSEFKFDAPKLPSVDAAKSSIPIINLVDKNESSGMVKQLPDVSAATGSVSFALSVNKSSINSDSIISNTTFSTPVSTECNIPKAYVSSSIETSSTITQQVPESKKLTEDSTSEQSSLPIGGFNFKIPSNDTLGGFPMLNNTVVSKPNENDSDKLTTEKQPPPKYPPEITREKKTVVPFSPFTLGTPAQSMALPFGLSTSSPSMFKVGESIDAPKSLTESPSLVKSTLTASTISGSAAAPTFSFSNNSSGTFSLMPNPTSQPNMPTPSGLLQFQSAASKNQDVKTVTAFSNAATPSTFSFGDAVTAPTTMTVPTTQPSVSSGFTFFSSASTTTTPSSSSNLFAFSASSQAAKPGGFTFKGANEEKSNPVSSNSLNFGVPTATTTATSSVFKFGSSVPASTGNFVFGAVKTEPVTTASISFAFGSGATSTTQASTFSGFQPTQSAATPVFQFGSQSSSGTAPAPQFGATNSFSFGSKSKTANPLSQPASTAQAPAAGFGCAPMQPMFGSTPAPAFGKTDKPGFNFGAAATGAAPVFQFGNTEKKPAVAPQFSFGAPSQEAATPSSFQPQFNMSTPPSFNFGAASTQGGPFQFAASSDSVNQSSAPRKIRKALRRVLPKH